ncbi:MAG: PspC domain-containing protein, partial [Halanaerobium sp. MSAO_Bac5]
ILIFISGAGLIAYIVAWAIIPEKPSHIDVSYEAESEPFTEEQNADKEDKTYDI